MIAKGKRGLANIADNALLLQVKLAVESAQLILRAADPRGEENFPIGRAPPILTLRMDMLKVRLLAIVDCFVE